MTNKDKELEDEIENRNKVETLIIEANNFKHNERHCRYCGEIGWAEGGIHGCPNCLEQIKILQAELKGRQEARKELQEKIMKMIDEWWNNQPELRTEKSINELKQNLNKLFVEKK